ncbi:MAG TPA: alkaline phosphatase family protein [Thermoanaerobaculia bacterium]|nr:alkaline phosphatase family protein [Thermoanaerobaculia bacterium]
MRGAMKSKRSRWLSAMLVTLSAASALAGGGALLAAEGPVPRGIQPLDHVYLIMMENHGYSQILNNPNAPFINQFAKSANLATNYFAIGHPSLTNYLEVVGGSNFGVQNDNDPDWHNASCKTNLSSGIAATDNPPTPAICPIAGTGTDAATPVVDNTNEVQGPPGLINIDGVQSIPATANTVGKTIADQLAAAGLTWKTYQESLPPGGPNGVNYSDGFFTDRTDFSAIKPALTPPLSQSSVVKLYAAKHNPFVYFRSVQEGRTQHLSLDNVAGFEGPNGLYADLRLARVPTFAFIAPNQCNDQHGRGNAGAFCNYDPTSDGSQAGLNPALIFRGDVTVQRIVEAIESSYGWRNGNNAIVVMWDENDYSTAPNTNQVMVIVLTNYGARGVQSAQRYNHFSLLKTLEAAFGLPCLNHACENDVKVMSDLFR